MTLILASSRCGWLWSPDVAGFVHLCRRAVAIVLFSGKRGSRRARAAAAAAAAATVVTSASSTGMPMQ